MIDLPIAELVDKVRVKPERVREELKKWDGTTKHLARLISYSSNPDLTNWLLLELLDDSKDKLSFRVSCEHLNASNCRAGKMHYYKTRIEELNQEEDSFSQKLVHFLKVALEVVS